MYSGMHPYHTTTHHTVDRGALRPTYYGGGGLPPPMEPPRKRGYGFEEGEGMKRSRGGEMKREGSKKLQFEDLRPELQNLLDESFSKLKISRSDIDSCVYDSLMDFPEPVQDEIVRAFGHADLLSLRNKTGYFIGILKEYRKHGKAISQGNTPDGGPPMPPRSERVKTGSITALPHSVQDSFHNLFAAGHVSATDLDKSIYDSLIDFDEATQLAILDKFSAADFTTVKNKTGFFISMLKLARESRKNGTPFGNAAGRVQFVQGQNFKRFGQSEPTYLSPPLYDTYGNFTHNGNNFYGGAPQHQQQLPPHHHLQNPSYSDSYYDTQRGGGPIASRYGAPVSVSTPSSGYSSAPGGYSSAPGGYSSAPGGYSAAPGGYSSAPGGFSSSTYGGALSVPDGVPPSFFKIAPSAQAILANMYNSHMLQPQDLDECVFDSISTFGEAEQNVMCEGFSQTALGRIRNRTAFFIGILKRHRQARAPTNFGGPGNFGGPANFGGGLVQNDTMY